MSQASLQIKDLPLVMAMHSILVKLKSSNFSMPLAEKLAKTMTGFLALSANFINMREVKVVKRQANWPSEQAKG